jgi:apolipoprotein N-acyltransferase
MFPADTVPFIAKIVGDQVPADFTRGKEPVIFSLTTDQVKVAPLICFEDTLGELTRQFVLRGANLLANVTNDGWFLRSAGGRQHLANAVFRCVETRRPMVRAANTGVTCFVNRFGRSRKFLLDSKGAVYRGVLTGTLGIYDRRRANLLHPPRRALRQTLRRRDAPFSLHSNAPAR